MPKFKIYSGLSGSFGGAVFCGVYDCEDKDEAESIAREEAMQTYESYGAYNGLYSWDSMRQEIANELYDGDIELVDPDDVDMRLMEEVENWLTYKIIPVRDDFPLDWDEDGDDDEYNEHNDDPDDCYFV